MMVCNAKLECMLLTPSMRVSLSNKMVSHIKGNLEQRREIAKVAISHLLDRAKNKTGVKEIIEKLELLAKENKVDFIYKRQGNYFTFSYHNHRWKGEKVSGTWLEIMAFAKKRENVLPEEKVHLRSRL